MKNSFYFHPCSITADFEVARLSLASTFDQALYRIKTTPAWIAKCSSTICKHFGFHPITNK
jgi:hypothetical protein